MQSATISLTTIILGIVAGTLTYIASRAAEKVLLAPRLRITYRNEPGFAQMDRHVKAEGGFDDYNHLRLMVANDFIHAATGCRVYLTGLEILHHGNWMSPQYNEAIRLRWSYEEVGQHHRGIDIPKGVGFFFEVVTISNPWAEPRDVAIRWAIDPHRHKELPSYGILWRMTLVATAENAEPYECKIEVDVSSREPVLKSIRGRSYSPFLRAIEDYNNCSKS